MPGICQRDPNMQSVAATLCVEEIIAEGLAFRRTDGHSKARAARADESRGTGRVVIYGPVDHCEYAYRATQSGRDGYLCGRDCWHDAADGIGAGCVQALPSKELGYGSWAKDGR